jgi:hypothetical protein
MPSLLRDPDKGTQAVRRIGAHPLQQRSRQPDLRLDIQTDGNGAIDRQAMIRKAMSRLPGLVFWSGPENVHSAYRARNARSPCSQRQRGVGYMGLANSTTTGRPAYPLWLRIPYTLFVIVLVPIYWREYGPGNFLWFSDIALFAVLICLWTGNRLLFSMMAVGVLPLETVWMIDFFTGGALVDLAGYMFSDEYPLYLRALSLFHLFLPPILIWMLVRQGYDPRALPAQTVLAWIILPATRLLTSPDDNVNWVSGPGEDPQQFMDPLLYLGLYMLLLPIVVYLPMHALLKRLFGRTTSPCRRGSPADPG